MSSGDAGLSFLSLHLEGLERAGKTSDAELHRLKLAAFQLYGAGGETTSSVLMVFVLVMLQNPEVQRKAQMEIDAVIGQKRLPNFGDRESLPYIEALLNEVMRWHPVTPLGVPHRNMTDDVYRKMFIPQGSTIIANTRYMMMNPKVYHDPHSFNPERFLPKPAGRGEPIPNSTFGFGRRICPGRFLGEANVWVVIASILAAFDIKPFKDQNGLGVQLEVEFVTFLTSHPKPFKCDIRPRAASSPSVIEGE